MFEKFESLRSLRVWEVWEFENRTIYLYSLYTSQWLGEVKLITRLHVVLSLRMFEKFENLRSLRAWESSYESTFPLHVSMTWRGEADHSPPSSSEFENVWEVWEFENRAINLYSLYTSQWLGEVKLITRLHLVLSLRMFELFESLRSLRVWEFENWAIYLYSLYTSQWLGEVKLITRLHLVLSLRMFEKFESLRSLRVWESSYKSIFPLHVSVTWRGEADHSPPSSSEFENVWEVWEFEKSESLRIELWIYIPSTRLNDLER